VSPRISVPPGLDFTATVDVTGLGGEAGGGGDVTGLAGAIADARDKGLICYLEDAGVQVAAIVPVVREPAPGVPFPAHEPWCPFQVTPVLSKCTCGEAGRVRLRQQHQTPP
jgi:hypothetical protein